VATPWTPLDLLPLNSRFPRPASAGRGWEKGSSTNSITKKDEGHEEILFASFCVLWGNENSVVKGILDFITTEDTESTEST